MYSKLLKKYILFKNFYLNIYKCVRGTCSFTSGIQLCCILYILTYKKLNSIATLFSFIPIFLPPEKIWQRRMYHCHVNVGTSARVLVTLQFSFEKTGSSVTVFLLRTCLWLAVLAHIHCFPVGHKETR